MEQEYPYRFLFRAWSRSSAGTNSLRGFRSGDRHIRNLTDVEKEEHFSNHADQSNRVPTCFISTTSDLIRAMKIAIEKDVQGEEDVHISFIQSNDCVSAEALADEFGLRSWLFKTEFLFPWEIEANEIVHVVSLATLIENQLLDRFKVLNDASLPPLQELREQICENNEKAWNKNRNTWPERSGRYVAKIAKCFGAGAPHRAIASLIWEHGTHFVPWNYEEDGLDERVRDAIKGALGKNVKSCGFDGWCGELADI
jgi:hypothetical protein